MIDLVPIAFICFGLVVVVGKIIDLIAKLRANDDGGSGMNKQEQIIKALDMLCDVLVLGRSESSTERLFYIMTEVFNGTSGWNIGDEIYRSHLEGLCLDVRGMIADALIGAAELNSAE